MVEDLAGGSGHEADVAGCNFDYFAEQAAVLFGRIWGKAEVHWDLDG